MRVVAPAAEAVAITVPSSADLGTRAGPQVGYTSGTPTAITSSGGLGGILDLLVDLCSVRGQTGAPVALTSQQTVVTCSAKSVEWNPTVTVTVLDRNVAGAYTATITHSVAPVGRKDDPRAQIYIVDHLQPGATIRRRVEVANTTDSAARIAVYPAAATVEDGVFGFADDRTHNELTSWTTVRPDVLDVPSGGTATAEVTVAVPADAGGGERYGVVWAEHVSAAPTGGGVGAVSRVGVRMYLSVGGPVEPPSAFEVDTLTARRLDDGTPVVEALVHNTGRRALDMRGELQLSDGPGALPAGPWTVRIALRSGQLERAVEGEIRFPDALGAAAPQVRARQLPLTQHERVAMLVAIALVLLLMLALLCFLLWGRRRTDEPDDDRSAGALAPAPAPAPAGSWR